MSKELIDLIDDLHQMQTLLDFTAKGLVGLSTKSTKDSLRLTEFEAYQISEYTRDMVDTLIKRVEEAFKEQFCKPMDWYGRFNLQVGQARIRNILDNLEWAKSKEDLILI